MLTEDRLVRTTVQKAPRERFELSTRRLIPARRDSTVEQLLAYPACRLHAFDLPLAGHGGGSCGLWLFPDHSPRAVFVRERGVAAARIVVLGHAALRLVADTHVEPASGVLENVNPKTRRFGIQAPRGGLNSIQGLLNAEPYRLRGYVERQSSP